MLTVVLIALALLLMFGLIMALFLWIVRLSWPRKPQRGFDVLPPGEGRDGLDS